MHAIYFQARYRGRKIIAAANEFDDSNLSQHGMSNQVNFGDSAVQSEIEGGPVHYYCHCIGIYGNGYD